MPASTLARRKRHSLAALVFLLGCMAALTAAAVPLYRLFCQVTGFGGTPRIAERAPDAGEGTEGMPSIVVRFNADTARGLPWEFRPLQPRVRARLGEQTTVFYEASNPTRRAIAGSATFNVTPAEMGPYFAKIDCFCFVEQVLEPGETVTMPVTFFVDPELAHDRDARKVGTMTLSYTFFERAGAVEVGGMAPSGAGLRGNP